MQGVVRELSDGTAEIRGLPEEWFRDYVGGEGVAARLFLDLGGRTGSTRAGQPLIFAAGTAFRNSRALQRAVCGFLPLACGRNAGGLQRRRALRSGTQAERRGSVGDHRRRVVPEDPRRGRRCGTSGGCVESLGQGRRRDGGRREGTARRLGMAGGLHRPRGREPGALRRDHDGQTPRFWAGRSRRRHGEQETQGRGDTGDENAPLADPEELREAAKAAREELFAETFVREELHPSVPPPSTTPSKAWGSSHPKLAAGRVSRKPVLLGHKAYHESLR